MRRVILAVQTKTRLKSLMSTVRQHLGRIKEQPGKNPRSAGEVSFLKSRVSGKFPPAEGSGRAGKLPQTPFCRNFGKTQVQRMFYGRPTFRPDGPPIRHVNEGAGRVLMVAFLATILSEPLAWAGSNSERVLA